MSLFQDYARADVWNHGGPPTERLTHIIRPSKTGVESHGLRTLCGLGRRHNVWRITLEGVRTNVNGDGWSVCVVCCLRSKPWRASPPVSEEP